MNTVGAWLAQDDYQDNQPVDLVILAGNAVIPAIDAACKNAAEQGVPLIISGGIGHSTTFLYAAIAKHPRYNRIPTTGRAEAAILADIAREFWNIPAEHLHVEDQSTNCGENARFSRALMKTIRTERRPGAGGAGPDDAAAHNGYVCPRMPRRGRSARMGESSRPDAHAAKTATTVWCLAARPRGYGR